jgi:alpha-glucuronidase
LRVAPRGDVPIRSDERVIAMCRSLETRWISLRGKVDKERYQAALVKLRRQSEDAVAWRDKCVRYFQTMRNGSAFDAARLLR